MIGEPYPVDDTLLAIFQLFSMLQMLSFGLMFMGNIPILGSWNERKGTIIMVIWVMNQVIGQMVQSGAFEVYYEGNLLFSKLQTGRMPSYSELQQKLSVYLDTKDDDSFSSYLESNI
jgi:hypothetical protein